MTHRWTDRLSEYLDGSLEEAERLVLETHIAECEPCARTLEELRAVVTWAGHLEDTEAPAELWAGVRKGIETETRGAPVIELTSRGATGPRARRRVNLTVLQLVAAGLALVLMSGGGALLLRPDPASPPREALAEPGLPVHAIAAGAPAAGQAQAAELAQLQELLASHRADLSPNTVRILRKNLAVIDRAIEESRQALAVDPGNTYLEGHLERSYEKKLEYLREASATFQWST